MTSARIRLARAESLLRQHDLAGTRQVLQVVVDDPEAFPAGAARDLLGRLALAEALAGRLRRAAEHARLALSLTDGHGEPPSAAPEVALAWVRTDEYDLSAAGLHSEHAEMRLSACPDALLSGLLALVRARIHRARGEVARAAGILGQPHEGLPAWLAEVVDLTRTALLAPGSRPAGGGTTAQHAIAEAAAALAAARPLSTRSPRPRPRWRTATPAAPGRWWLSWATARASRWTSGSTAG
ncbi:hypothetical protein [Paractinoplanes hotanensis]|uniref:Uncharacterized protein n=1 Tax=Paractinoplanes hotanensis TaxID=2906497 RepID=A0ABT0Y2R0_9ACTN|nr:hypothetical protein [Actinoplanes hotanensis]MCM4080305.1 hypothetical protein [Actinoplanes hotanensis]